MPTNRPTKRLLMPLAIREKTIVETIIEDQSQLHGTSHSNTILRDVVDSQLPQGEFGRFHAARVFAGDCTLLGSLASVLQQNVTGSIGMAAHPDYKPLIEFGLSLINRKNLGTALSNHSAINHHLVSRFVDVVDELERHAEGVGDMLEKHGLTKKIAYGRDLVIELDPDRAAFAPASALVLFAIENFEEIGRLNSTCAYLSDAFRILAEVESGNWGNRITPPDTPELRARWTRVLDVATNEWILR